MDKADWEISDLLALRDGEPRAAGIDENDPDVIAALGRVRGIRHELQDLPDVPVSDAVWESVLEQKTPEKPSAAVYWLRFPLATAASVFFASIIGIYFIFGGAADGPATGGQALQNQFAGTTTQVELGGLQLAGLMNRSQELERSLRGSSPLTQASGQVTSTAAEPPKPTVIEFRLMGRLADVDTQIARLYEADEVDATERERLWTQRVSLLESLVAIRGGRDPRIFENSLGTQATRSM